MSRNYLSSLLLTAMLSNPVSATEDSSGSPDRQYLRSGILMSNDQIALFESHGGSIQRAKELTEMGFPSVSFDHVQAYGTSEDLDELVALSTLPARQKGWMMAQYIENGGTPELTSLLQKRLSPDSVLELSEWGDFLESGGTVNDLECLLDLERKDWKDRTVPLLSLSSIAEVQSAKGTCTEVQELASHKASFGHLFSEYDIVDIIKDKDLLSDIWGLRNIMVRDVYLTESDLGTPLVLEHGFDRLAHFFNHGNEMISFLRAGYTREDALLLARKMDNNGNPLFQSAGAINAYRERGASIGDMLALSQLPISERKIHAAIRYGLLPDMFTTEDTDKPNAVFIYPTDDWNGALTTLLDFQKELEARYDVFMSIAESEKDVYHALEQNKGAHLLVLVGHGNKTSIELGSQERAYFSKRNGEEFAIDRTDNEFAHYLGFLDPKARIQTISCSNGKGGDNADNIANQLHDWSGKRVFSGTDMYPIEALKVESWFPYTARLQFEGKDITHIAGDLQAPQYGAFLKSIGR